mmetsp:Transcript_22515/g.29226  ORF Transcript_22515/g.29226 Transcript_22515/m.29226 type:complete len:667 (+) Transcript_22515:145-2145(+)
MNVPPEQESKQNPTVEDGVEKVSEQEVNPEVQADIPPETIDEKPSDEGTELKDGAEEAPPLKELSYSATLKTKETNLSRVNVPVKPNFFATMFTPEDRRLREGVTSVVCPNPKAWYTKALLLHHEPIRMALLEMQLALSQTDVTLSQIQKLHVWNASFFTTLMKFYFDSTKQLQEIFDEKGITVHDSSALECLKAKAALADFKATFFGFDFTKSDVDPEPLTCSIEALSSMKDTIFLMLEQTEMNIFPQIKEKVSAGEFISEEEYFARSKFYFEHEDQYITAIVCPWLMDSAKVWMTEDVFEDFLVRDLEDFGERILNEWYDPYEKLNRGLIDSIFDEAGNSALLPDDEIFKTYLQATAGISSVSIPCPASDMDYFIVSCGECLRKNIKYLADFTSEKLLTQETCEWKGKLFFSWFEHFCALLEVFDAIFSKGLVPLSSEETQVEESVESDKKEEGISELMTYQKERWEMWLQKVVELSKNLKKYDPQMAAENHDTSAVESKLDSSIAEPADIAVGFAEEGGKNLWENLSSFREEVAQLTYFLKKLNGDRECILSFYLNLVPAEKFESDGKRLMQDAINSASSFFKYFPALLEAGKACGAEEALLLKFLPDPAQFSGNVRDDYEAKYESEYTRLVNILSANDKPDEQSSEELSAKTSSKGCGCSIS